MFSKFSNFLLSVMFLFLIIQPIVAHSRNLKSKKKYFQNFQNLKGSIHEGQTVKGLSEVKQYLQNFGYYPSNIFKLNDEFDQPLKSALETYQKNYLLNVTGTLNSATVKEMMVPRCGCPDIVTHNASKKHFHNSGKLHMVSHFSFFDGMPKWPSYDLTYRFIGLPVVSQQVLRDVCSRAFKKWSDVSQFKFREAPQGGRADISIGFYRGNHGDGANFDGPGRVLAHAFRPTIGHFHYDADESWSTNPTTRNQVDLESVAIHEIGHLLGLGHSQDRNAIMFAEIPGGAIKRNIGQDDINGIRTLYPPN